eukprot:gene14829-4399_t
MADTPNIGVEKPQPRKRCTPRILGSKATAKQGQNNKYANGKLPNIRVQKPLSKAKCLVVVVAENDQHTQKRQTPAI